MLINLPQKSRRPVSQKKPKAPSISQILRDAYKRHTKESLALKAVKRYLR